MAFGKRITRDRRDLWAVSERFMSIMRTLRARGGFIIYYDKHGNQECIYFTRPKKEARITRLIENIITSILG